MFWLKKLACPEFGIPTFWHPTKQDMWKTHKNQPLVPWEKYGSTREFKLHTPSSKKTLRVGIFAEYSDGMGVFLKLCNLVWSINMPSFFIARGYFFWHYNTHFRIPSSQDCYGLFGSSLAFEAYLRRTAEEIIDRTVHMVIEDVDRIVFEEEVSDVTMW